MCDRADARPIPTSGSRSPSPRRIGRRIDEAAPDHIHIATEGPIGWLTRRYCLKRKRRFHHQLPHPVSRIRVAPASRIPERLTYAALRRFPRARGGGDGADADDRRRSHPPRLPACAAMDARRRPRRCSGRAPDPALDLPRPIFLSVGRVAVEKNLEALLDLDLPGSTVIVGDGPARAALAAPLPARAFSRRDAAARRSPTFTRAPTSSSSRRAPTRSASC